MRLPSALLLAFPIWTIAAPPAPPAPPARPVPTADPGASASQSAPPQPAPPQPAPERCLLFQPQADRVPSADCVACHEAARGALAVHASHPIGVEYGAAQGKRRGGDLRAAEEVAARGVRLPGGKVECVSCHDGSSPWAGRIALPRGAPAIARDDARALSDDATNSWRTADPRAPPPPAGSAVVSAPLCAACHTTAD